MEPLEDRCLLSLVPTWTTLSASALAMSVGDTVTLTAKVAPASADAGTPTGSVEFIDTATHTAVATVALSGGEAKLSTASLAQGYHALIAHYSGDAVYQESTTTVGSDSSIRTVAGTGTTGFSGDGGLAVDAALSQPMSIEVGGDGSLYIADAGNHRVRKVDLHSGIITTIAGTGATGNTGDGGQATAAEFNNPTGLALDPTGSLYIADYWYGMVRRVNLSTGVISTVHGGIGGVWSSIPADLTGPQGMAVDAQGNLLVADSPDNLVYQIEKPDQYYANKVKIAGTGIAGYSGNGGSATSAKLDFPTDVAVDAAGNIYRACLFISPGDTDSILLRSEREDSRTPARAMLCPPLPCPEFR